MLRTHPQVHTHACMYPRTHPCMHAPTHTPMHAPTHPPIHTHTRTHTYTHIYYTHTYTDTHTHIYIYVYIYMNIHVTQIAKTRHDDAFLEIQIIASTSSIYLNLLFCSNINAVLQMFLSYRLDSITYSELTCMHSYGN